MNCNEPKSEEEGSHWPPLRSNHTRFLFSFSYSDQVLGIFCLKIKITNCWRSRWIQCFLFSHFNIPCEVYSFSSLINSHSFIQYESWSFSLQLFFRIRSYSYYIHSLTDWLTDLFIHTAKFFLRGFFHSHTIRNFYRYIHSLLQVLLYLFIHIP